MADEEKNENEWTEEDALANRLASGQMIEALDDSVDDLMEEAAKVSQEEELPLIDTALMLDEWTLSRGDELIEDEGACAEFMADIDDRSEARNNAADLFSAAFSIEPEMAPRTKSKRLQQLIRSILNSEDGKELRESTVLDVETSQFACAVFAKQWKLMRSAKAPESEFEGEVEGAENAHKCVKEAVKVVNEWQDCKHALGMGGDGGNEGGRMPTEEIRKRFNRIRDNPTLARICELAGRYRHLAASRQRHRTQHGRDDMIGIEMGGSVSRMLSSQKALLAVPELELLMLDRIARGQVIQRKYAGIERQARGPIVCVVDESGSMCGEPIAMAKAMALAMSWVAKQQKRLCVLVGYSGSEDGNFLVIPPEGCPPDDLMDWLEHFYSGGTCMDVPLDMLPRRWSEFGLPDGRTDIVSITDAQCSVPDTLRDTFLEWKKEHQVKLTTLVIGADPGDLEVVSDRAYRVEDLGITQEGVEEAFDI